MDFKMFSLVFLGFSIGLGGLNRFQDTSRDFNSDFYRIHVVLMSLKLVFRGFIGFQNVPRGSKKFQEDHWGLKAVK